MFWGKFSYGKHQMNCLKRQCFINILVSTIALLDSVNNNKYSSASVWIAKCHLIVTLQPCLCSGLVTLSVPMTPWAHCRQVFTWGYFSLYRGIVPMGKKIDGWMRRLISIAGGFANYFSHIWLISTLLWKESCTNNSYKDFFCLNLKFTMKGKLFPA